MSETQAGNRMSLWGIATLIGILFIVDLLFPLGIAGGASYFTAVLIAMHISSERQIILIGVITTILTISGYFLSYPTSEFSLVITNRTLAVVLIWFSVLYTIWHKRRNEVVLREERLYRVLFESSVEAVFIVDKFGKINDANNTTLKLFGYEREELIGQDVSSIMPERHLEGHIDFAKHYENGGPSRKMAELKDLYAKRKNGTEFPVEISLSNFRSDNDVLAMALVSDITERKEVEKELKRSEQRYRSLFETIVQGVIIQNQKGQVVSANPAVHRILGVEMGEVDGIDHFDPEWKFVNADGTELPPESYPMMKVFKTGKPIMNAVVGIYHEGDDTPVWVDISAFPNFKDNESEPYEVVSTFEDITQRKQAKDNLETLNIELEKRVEARSRALKESQEMYKMIARNFPNGVINVLDRNLNYIFAEGMEMYRLGITSEALIGSSFISRIPEDVRDEIQRELLSVFDGEDVSFELSTDGKTYMIYAVAMSGDQDEPNQLLMVSQNVTGMKKAEERTRQTLKKERELNELKSRFVSMASHEFRTPLTSAMNSLTLLSKYIYIDGSIEKQERHLGRINSAIHHLINILNDFLSIDKLEEGKVMLNIFELNLLEFIDEVMEDVDGLLKEGQKINRTHVGDTALYADKMMMKNIFNNLLSNAIKYSAEGSEIKLDTSLAEGRFKVVVKDEGIGIPKEDQYQVFERFFRATNATDIQGTGLGLSIIKKYVEMMNGEISFTSVEQKGSTFTLILPSNMELIN